MQPVVGIVMGSSSDLEVMGDAVTILTRFGVDHEVHVVSAHRTPKRLYDYASSAEASITTGPSLKPGRFPPLAARSSDHHISRRV